MRILIAILPLAACAASPAETTSYASVRERLTAEPTRMFVPAAADAGTLVARRWSSTDGWVDGAAPVALANGELVGQLVAGKLVVKQFDFAVDAIDLPATITGSPLQLRDVRVELAAAPAAELAWTGDDDATAQLPVALTLAWSIAHDGTVTPLAAQKLDTIAMDIALTGAGDHVDATLGLHGQGTLWSWAELLELTKLDITLAAATVE